MIGFLPELMTVVRLRSKNRKLKDQISAIKNAMQQAIAKNQETKTPKYSIPKNQADIIRETNVVKTEISLLKRKLADTFDNNLDSLQAMRNDLRNKLKGLNHERNLVQQGIAAQETSIEELQTHNVVTDAIRDKSLQVFKLKSRWKTVNAAFLKLQSSHKARHQRMVYLDKQIRALENPKIEPKTISQSDQDMLDAEYALVRQQVLRDKQEKRNQQELTKAREMIFYAKMRLLDVDSKAHHHTQENNSKLLSVASLTAQIAKTKTHSLAEMSTDQSSQPSLMSVRSKPSLPKVQSARSIPPRVRVKQSPERSVNRSFAKPPSESSYKQSPEPSVNSSFTNRSLTKRPSEPIIKRSHTPRLARNARLARYSSNRILQNQSTFVTQTGSNNALVNKSFN